MGYKYLNLILDLKSKPNLLLFLEVYFVAIITLYILFSIRKAKVWLIVLPFFSLCLLPILNVGIFNTHTFIDSDLSLHKSFLDMLMNSGGLYNDRALQVYSKVYPPGYHYLLYPFYRIGISVPLLSKFLGIILSLIIPFIFYYLGLVIYEKKELAFFCGLFAYIPSIWDTVYLGLPRSVGFVAFLLSMVFLFKYQKTRSISYLLAMYLSVILALVVHPLTFTLSLIIIFIFLIVEVILKNNLKEFYRLLRDLSIFFIVTSPFLIPIVLNQKELWEFSSWHSMRQSGLFMRVPYANVKIKDMIFSTGLLPCLLFLYSLFYYYFFKTERQKTQVCLFIVSFLMLFIVGAILFFDKLFFLKAHRFPPFISSLFYLSSTLLIKRACMYLKTRILFAAFVIALTILPAISQIDKSIKNGVLPYVLHRQGGYISFPNPDPVTFEEIKEMAGKIKEIVPETDIIACPLRLGDVLRMYAQRSITAGDKIGGVVTTYKKAGEIFKEQLSDSVILYDNPLSLYKKYGARYFLLEKSELRKDNLMPFGFSILFQTENLILYTYDVGK